jgi:hypothetical protein
MSPVEMPPRQFVWDQGKTAEELEAKRVPAHTEGHIDCPACERANAEFYRDRVAEVKAARPLTFGKVLGAVILGNVICAVLSGLLYAILK